MWILVFLAYAHGRPLDGLTDQLAGFRFQTEQSCLLGAVARADALRHVGVHGSYLCMYHGESDRDLRRAVKVTF